MIGEYRFFQEFFDGQIVKDETPAYKMFKLLLVSCFSVFGIFSVLIGWCSPLVLVLFEVGMLWNIFLKLNNKLSYLFCLVVSFTYFYIASKFAIYANALIYIACYIPFQLIATNKDYSEGEFVQIKKKVTDLNKILLVIFYVVLFVTLYLVDYDFGSRFIILDVLSASLLVCSALLRNERYLEYYLFRIFALIASIVLWIFVALEYGSPDAVLVILMYVSYLIFDVVNFCVQNLTYESDYTLHAKMHEAEEAQKLADEKIEEYKKAKESGELEAPAKEEQTPKPRKKATKTTEGKQQEVDSGKASASDKKKTSGKKRGTAK